MYSFIRRLLGSPFRHIAVGQPTLLLHAGRDSRECREPWRAQGPGAPRGPPARTRPPHNAECKENSARRSLQRSRQATKAPICLMDGHRRRGGGAPGALITAGGALSSLETPNSGWWSAAACKRVLAQAQACRGRPPLAPARIRTYCHALLARRRISAAPSAWWCPSREGESIAW